MRAERLEVAGQRPDIPPGHRSGERPLDAEGAGVAEGLLDEAAVDRERAGLVEPRDSPELGDRIEERHEAAGREDGCCVVGRLRAGRQADRRCTDGIGHLREERRQLLAALDGDRRAVERGDRPLGVRERDERMKRPDLRAGGACRLQNLRTERTGGVDHGLAAVHPELAGKAPDDVVWNGEDDELDLVEQRVCFGEPARPGYERAEALPVRLVAGCHGPDRPAGSMKRRPERRADGPGADDPGHRWLAGLRLGMGMAVRARLRIQVDAFALEGVERFRIGRGACPGCPLVLLATASGAPDLHGAAGVRRPRRGPAAESRYSSMRRV